MAGPWQKYRGTVSYNGLHLSGWQRQKNTPNTVQEYLEEGLGEIFQEQIKVIAAGRTDAGVHALGQVMHFLAPHRLNPERLLLAINSSIPRSIAVISLEEAQEDFHALAQAKEKWYRYRILHRRARCPLRQGQVFFHPRPLNMNRMEEGAQYVRGCHDFTSFCAARSTAETRVRDLQTLDITGRDDEIHLDFKGPGFLYKMVRNITGVLLQVGRGVYPPERVKEIREALDRREAAFTAPAYGLTLMAVRYGDEEEKVFPREVTGCWEGS